MPRRTVAPARPNSRAPAMIASTSGRPSKVSFSPIWTRNLTPSRGMQIPSEGVRLRVHIGENDTFEGRPLVDAIIAGAREFGLAGATVRRGISGFGDSSQIHQVELVLSHDLPVVIDITD